MNAEQLESLESIYAIRDLNYILPGVQNDGSFYNSTKSHEWNTQGPSLAMRQYNTLKNATQGENILSEIFEGKEDLHQTLGESSLIRVATIYWKSQRKVGHLTKITEDGELIQEIIDESYVITDKPMYNTTLYKNKDKNSLIFGEHIDWIWNKYRDWETDRKSTRLNSSHSAKYRMPSSA